MRRTGAVRAGDYMMAYGLPCEVLKIKALPERRIISVACRDMYTGELQCVQVRQGEQFVQFTPVRTEHLILFVEDGLAMTSTDAVIELRNDEAKAGDTAHTLEAPTCVNGEWASRLGIEKITEGAPIDPVAILDEVERGDGPFALPE